MGRHLNKGGVPRLSKAAQMSLRTERDLADPFRAGSGLDKAQRDKFHKYALNIHLLREQRRAINFNGGVSVEKRGLELTDEEKNKLAELVGVPTSVLEDQRLRIGKEALDLFRLRLERHGDERGADPFLVNAFSSTVTNPNSADENSSGRPNSNSNLAFCSDLSSPATLTTRSTQKRCGTCGFVDCTKWKNPASFLSHTHACTYSLAFVAQERFELCTLCKDAGLLPHQCYFKRLVTHQTVKHPGHVDTLNAVVAMSGNSAAVVSADIMAPQAMTTPSINDNNIPGAPSPPSHPGDL